MKGDYQTCLTHPKTGKVNCRQPEILIDGGQGSFPRLLLEDAILPIINDILLGERLTPRSFVKITF